MLFLVFRISHDTYKRGAQCGWDTGETAGIPGGEKIMTEFIKEVIEVILETAAEILGETAEDVIERVRVRFTGGRKKR